MESGTAWAGMPFRLAMVALVLAWADCALIQEKRHRTYHKSSDPGLGPPISAWYFSLKTSKGYCGLMPLSAAAGGYGFAMVCNSGTPVYDSQFTLLLPPAVAEEASASGTGAPGTARQPELAGSGVGGDAEQSEPQGQGEEQGQEWGQETEVHSATEVAWRGTHAAARARAVLGGGSSEGMARGGDAGGRAMLQTLTPDEQRQRQLGHGGFGRALGPLLLQRGDEAVDAHGVGAVSAASAPSAGDAGAGGAGAAPGGGSQGLHDPNAPITITSGRPVRLLSRTAGLCGTQPPPGPPRPPAAAPGSLAEQQQGQLGSPALEYVAGTARQVLGFAIDSLRWAGCEAVQALLRFAAAAGIPFRPQGTCSTAFQLSGTVTRSHSSSTSSTSSASSYAAVGDIAPWPVSCVLAQPAASQWRLFKPDLKPDESVNLGTDWVYLMEGDKYCTLADVAGMTAVVSCHLDAPGWTGYKFQLQTMSYPRSQLASRLTGGPCGVRLPVLPAPHDWECGQGEAAQAGRSPDFDLVLQTPGAALVGGVVVGMSTFTLGVVGIQQQRCCAQPSSPHIILCEAPTPGVAVSPECWFQMYDVKFVRSESRVGEEDLPDPEAEDAAAASRAGSADGDGGAVAASGGGSGGSSRRSTGVTGILRTFLRSLTSEMSPAGLASDLPDLPYGEGSDNGHNGGGFWSFPWPAAATPIGDGALVMLLSKAFSRYCSVSIDGTLLCVSAQASNATRNLFTVMLPPLPPFGWGAVEAVRGTATVQEGSVPGAVREGAETAGAEVEADAGVVLLRLGSGGQVLEEGRGRGVQYDLHPGLGGEGRGEESGAETAGAEGIPGDW